jgi:gliding motility-associated-like protein
MVTILLLSGSLLPASAQIIISFSGTPPTCSNYTNGEVSAIATGGQAPYTYVWSTGSQSNTIYEGAGTYSVTVTDENNLTAEAVFTLEAPAPLTALISPLNSDCEGTDGSYVCNPTGGTPPYSYNWSTGDTDNQVDQPGFGYLSVTVTDDQGCMKVGGRNVREPMTVEVQIVNVVCAMLCDGSAEAVITGGYGPYTFIWNNGATSQVIFPLAPGQYTVTVTDAYGCSVVASGTVFEPPPISVTIDVDDPCTGNSTVTADASGGTPPFTYEWSNGETGPVINNVGQGVYFVTVTDANLCKKTANITVSAGNINVTAIANDALCNGVNNGSATIYVSGGVGPYTYDWIGGLSGNIQQNLGAGNYTVTVTDATGCTNEDSFEIGNIQTVNIDLTTSPDGCNNSNNSGTATAVVTGGTSPYNFQWSMSNDNDPFVTGLGAGNYSLTVTDENGCFSIENFELLSIPFLHLNITTTAASCPEAENGTAFANATGGYPPYSYEWSNNSSDSASVHNYTAGNYAVTVTDALGCIEAEHFQVAAGNDYPDISLTTTESGCNNTDIGTAIAVATGGATPYTYNWSNTGQTNSQVTNLAAGTFTVTVSDIHGCSSTTSGEVLPAIPFTIELLGTNASCNNTFDGSAAVQLIGTAPDTFYIWNNNAITPLINNLTPGIYSVTVTSSNGCTSSESVLIDTDVTLTLSLSSDESGCNNANNGSATVQIAGGVTPYQIQWNDPANQTTETAVNLAPGTYQVTVLENGGCSNTAEIEVQNAMPFSISLATENSSCQDIADGSATITVMGDYELPLNVQWNVPGSDLVLENLLPGNYEATVTDANSCSAQTVFTIAPSSTVNAGFFFEILGCFGDSAEIAFIDNSSASSNINSWQWYVNGQLVSTASNFTMISDVLPLTVELIVTNDENCTASIMQTVDVNLVELEINALTDNFCEGTGTQLSVTTNPDDNLTYAWTATGASINNPSSPTPDILFDNNGTATIQVTATNQAGCFASDEISVTVNESDFNFEATLVSSNQSCQNYTITFINTNATNVSYTWVFGDPGNPLGTSDEQNPEFTFPGPGIQQITIQPNDNCMDPVSFSIELTPPAEAAFNYAVTDCSETVTLGFTDISSTTPVDWEWQFGSLGGSTVQNPMLEVSTSQTIEAILITTFPNGCTDTVTQSIPVEMFQPIVPPADQFACAGLNVGINPDGDPDLNYLWSPGGSTEVNPIVSITSNTVYNVTISDNNGCEITAVVNLNIALPVDIQVSADIIACNDDPTTLQATSNNATSYIWSNEPDFTPVLGNQANLQVIPGNPVTYYVQVSDNTGCTNEASIEVGFYGLEYILAPDDTICTGSSAVIQFQNLNPEQILTLEWEPFDPTTMPVTLSNEFSLTITNEYGCNESAAVAVEVVDMSLTVDAIAEPDTINKGEFSQIISTYNDKYTYQWSPDISLTNTGIFNPVATPEETTTYCVTITDELGCVAERCVTVVVLNPPCQEPNIYFPNAFTPDGDGLNDVLFLYGSQVDEVHFVIYNRWGEKVFESFDQADGWDGTFRGQPVAPDAYGYYLEVKCIGGDDYFKKGNVTILK